MGYGIDELFDLGVLLFQLFPSLFKLSNIVGNMDAADQLSVGIVERWNPCSVSV
jgi:hypothetical protein